MTVVAAHLYKDGKRVRQVTLEEAVAASADPDEFVWVAVCDPTPQEMQTLQNTYDLHPLAVEDALDPRQIPKVDIYDTQIFIVAREARLDGNDICYGAMAIFVGHHHIISVQHGPIRPQSELRVLLEAAPRQLMIGVDYVLHALLSYSVDGYLPILEKLEDTVFDTERHSLDSFLGRDEITRLFAIRCQLARFQRTLGPMVEVTRKLVRGHLTCIGPEAAPYFNDVLDHMLRVQTMVDGLLHVLASVFEFSGLLEQQRTGVITRQLASWAAILAVPTAIAGIYGMNFAYIPGLATRFGFFAVLGMIGVICVALYVLFRRSKWL